MKKNEIDPVVVLSAGYVAKGKIHISMGRVLKPGDKIIRTDTEAFDELHAKGYIVESI